MSVWVGTKVGTKEPGAGVQTSFVKVLRAGGLPCHNGRMTTTTTAQVLANMALAARGWEGTTSVKSDHIRGILNRAAHEAQGVCAGCGEESELVAVAHIVSCGPRGKYWGYVAHNLYAACKPCNDFDREYANGDAIKVFNSIVRKDLIIAEVMERREALQWARDIRKERVFAKRAELIN